MSVESVTVAQLETVAIHEAAHGVVAAQWACDSVSVCIFPNEQGDPEGWQKNGPLCSAFGANFQDAAIGWAGCFAELMTRTRYASLDDLLGDFERGENGAAFCVSDEDDESIRAVPISERRESARVTFEILRERWAEVSRVAGALKAGYLANPALGCLVRWEKAKGWVLP